MKKIIILLFIFFSFWIIQTNASTLLDEVQNYYQLENNWNDSHTWSNLTVNWSFTNVKKVLWTYSFNRSSLAYDLYSLDNSFDFPWDFSISLWVNMTNMTNASQTIFSKQDTIRNYRLDYDETNKRFAYYSTDTGWVYSNFIDLSASVWYNIAFVRSWNEITFYNNWISYWTFTISWISQSNWWYLTIWNFIPTNSSWFTSTWDEISIFPIALSSDDISNLYNWWAWLSYSNFSITNYVWSWPSPLQVVSTWTLHSEIYWLDLNQFETNEDFDLTYWIDDITNSNILVDSDILWTQTWWIIDLEFHTYNYEYGVDYELNLALEDINFATWTTTINYPFTYLPTDWVLSTWSVNSIIAIENWLEIEFTCDTQCNIDYTIYFDFCEPWVACNEKTNSLGVVWPWTFTWTILSAWDLVFNNYEDYLIDFTISDINFPSDVNFFFSESVISYYFEPIPLVPVTLNDFSYTLTTHWTLSTWYFIENFDILPYWWYLWFDMITPTWTWVSWPYYYEWINSTTNAENVYWPNALTIINDAVYHSQVWINSFRPFYQYWELENYYPFWTWFIEYNVIEADLTFAPITMWDKCNSDENTEWWVLPWLSQFFYCSISLVQTWISNISTAYDWLKWFFITLWNIWNNVEPKQLFEAFNFEFIPSANAETYVYDEAEDPLKIISTWSFENMPLLNNIYNLVKYSILFGIFVYAMLLIFKPKENG